MHCCLASRAKLGGTPGGYPLLLLRTWPDIPEDGAAECLRDGVPGKVKSDTRVLHWCGRAFPSPSR
jgi:hypothetical protein